MEKTKIKLLAIQMESILGEIELNINSVENLLKENLEKYQPVDFVFLPELWTSGWDCDVLDKCAENLDSSQSLSMLKRIAKEYNVNIIGGSFVRKDEGKLFNSCPVINRNGELIAIYNKNHLFKWQ